MTFSRTEEESQTRSIQVLDSRHIMLNIMTNTAVLIMGLAAGL